MRSPVRDIAHDGFDSFAECTEAMSKSGFCRHDTSVIRNHGRPPQRNYLFILQAAELRRMPLRPGSRVLIRSRNLQRRCFAIHWRTERDAPWIAVLEQSIRHHHARMSGEVCHGEVPALKRGGNVSVDARKEIAHILL